MSDKCEETYIKISTEDLRQIISDEMNECLMRLGIDTKDWAEHQKDSAYIRKARQTSDKIGSMIMKTAIGIFVTGLLSMLVLGIKSYLNM